MYHYNGHSQALIQKGSEHLQKSPFRSSSCSVSISLTGLSENHCHIGLRVQQLSSLAILPTTRVSATYETHLIEFFERWTGRLVCKKLQKCAEIPNSKMKSSFQHVPDVAFSRFT